MPMAARPSASRGRDHFLRMRGAAQEGEIRGDGELGIARHGRRSREQAVDEPARRGRLASVEAFPKEPEAAAGLVLDQVVVARRPAPSCATIRRRCAPAPARGRRGSITPRQRKRRGGPSGTRAVTSAGSAAAGEERARRRPVRRVARPALPRRRRQGQRRAFRDVACDRLSRRTLARPEPLPQASTSAASALASWPPSERREVRLLLAPWARRRGRRAARPRSRSRHRPPRPIRSSRRSRRRPTWAARASAGRGRSRGRHGRRPGRARAAGRARRRRRARARDEIRHQVGRDGDDRVLGEDGIEEKRRRDRPAAGRRGRAARRAAERLVEALEEIAARSAWPEARGARR